MVNEMKETALSERIEKIFDILREVKDPEIPILSLLELKIIHDVVVSGESVTVRIVPTFLGCPALEQMKRDIVAKLNERGIPQAKVEVVFSPAWSTDLLDDDVREKLRRFGIAPPPRKEKNSFPTLALSVACPHCGSQQTRLENSFGPTLCRQLYYCDSCRQMFERFKPI
jgi:ring-1,2-phenylacetyl-CoA epoxidase subunit PaaD